MMQIVHKIVYGFGVFFLAASTLMILAAMVGLFGDGDDGD